MFLEIIKAIVLGAVEGLTEFLPISSTGHLILVNQVFTFSEKFTILFDIFIQLGAILAVLFYFRRTLWPFARTKVGQIRKEIINIWLKAIIGVVPAVVLGALLGGMITDKLFNPFVVVISLFLGGVVLILIESKQRENKINSIEELSFETAFFIGLIQCLAMIPGVSRAASTIIGAMMLGTSRLVAVEFSFFLAIPTMIAASSYSLLKYGLNIASNEAIILMVGFVVAFISALLVIKFLMQFIQKHNFKVFGWYRIILSAIILLVFLLK